VLSYYIAIYTLAYGYIGFLFSVAKVKIKIELANIL